jgi:hypothetical protein
MSQPRSGSLKRFASAIAFNIIFGVLLTLLPVRFDISKISENSLTLVLVVEILLVEVESYLFPAFAVWNEKKIIAKSPEEVLSRGFQLKNEAVGVIYGIWCYSGYDYPKLAIYFRQEKEILAKSKAKGKDHPLKIHRLINIGEAGDFNVEHHCREFKDEIINEQYVVTAVKYRSREFLIIDSKKALILCQDLISRTVAGGIGPYDDRNWVLSYVAEYEQIEKENATQRLKIDAANPIQSIRDWIKLNT